MTKKKIKKYIKLSLILILLVVIILILINLLKEFYSRENMLKRLISGIDNLNYNYTTSDGKNKVQVIGKYEKITTTVKEGYGDEGKEITKEIYNDYDKKITREILEDSVFMEEYSNNGIKDLQYYDEFIKGFLDTDEYYDYKYKGKKELNGKKCTLIEFIYPAEFAEREVYYWIDDNTNLICKVEKYQYNIQTDKMEKIDEKEYDLGVGSNKIEDIKISDEILSTHTTETNG